MAAPQQLLTRKANGVLPINPSNPGADRHRHRAKQPLEGHKVIVRRLPPGLTEAEFARTLGDTWRANGDKVGWVSYVPGKVSRDFSKPSRPARAYLHVKKQDDLPTLADHVRTASWEDAKETWTNTSLVGPPIAEFALYKKIPRGGERPRKDALLGTIDSDPDFMAFLHQLANPEAPARPSDGDASLKGGDADRLEKVTSTPLVEYMREKSATKAKKAENKAKAKQEAQTAGTQQAGEGKKKSKDKVVAQKKQDTATSAAAAEKTSNRKEAAQEVAKVAKAVAKEIKDGSEPSVTTPKSRRADPSAAARILARDLGLKPSVGKKARQEAARTSETSKEGETPGNATSNSTITNSPAASAVPNGNAVQSPFKGGRKHGGKEAAGNVEKQGKAVGHAAASPAAKPVVQAIAIAKRPDDAKKPAAAVDATTTAPNGPAAQRTPSVAPATATGTATSRAFVKHANPSQGVTELLLKEAMLAFGDVKFVEIDRRKGFAFVDFADTEGLQKAIKASPVKVANGAVQVLERKDVAVKKAVQPAANGNAHSQAHGAPANQSPVGAPSGPRGGRFRGGRGGRGGGDVGRSQVAQAKGDADGAPNGKAAAASTKQADVPNAAKTETVQPSAPAG